MKITIQVSSDRGNSASATIKTTTIDPAKEGSKTLLRLVRVIERQEKSSTYSVYLKATPKKIEVIKLVREISGLNLKEAKALVDGLGIIVRKLTVDELAVWTRGLDDCGAEYEVRN
jgi:large subunit ribosomal protein L7/L12